MKQYIRIKEERNSLIKILENLTFEEKKQVLRKVDQSMVNSANKVLANDNPPGEFLTKLPTKFKSEVQATFNFSDSSSLGMSYNHISNASLGDKNPGANSYMFNFLKKF